jgi:hypothetical protein
MLKLTQQLGTVSNIVHFILTKNLKYIADLQFGKDKVTGNHLKHPVYCIGLNGQDYE